MTAAVVVAAAFAVAGGLVVPAQTATPPPDECAFDVYVPTAGTYGYPSANAATMGRWDGLELSTGIECGLAESEGAYQIRAHGDEDAYVRASDSVRLPDDHENPEYADEMIALPGEQGIFTGIKPAQLKPWPAATLEQGRDVQPGTEVRVDEDLVATDATDGWGERAWVAAKIGDETGWIEAKYIVDREFYVPEEEETPEPTPTPIKFEIDEPEPEPEASETPEPAPAEQTPTPEVEAAPDTAAAPSVPWLLVGALLGALGLGWLVARRVHRVEENGDDDALD